MGIVFGVTGTAEPASAMLRSCAAANGLVAYEVRRMQPYIVAEVSCNISSENSDSAGSESQKANNGFSVLAKYIGVFGEPENQQRAPMAMTAPVITTEPRPQKLAMTAPVVTTPDDAMQFVLPFEYTDVAQAPQPMNKAVRLKAVPPRIVAVTRFSGWYSKSIGHQKLKQLHQALARDELISEAERTAEPESLQWNVAQYHPPFTLPFLRRNEVWIELQPSSSPAVAELVKKYDSEHSGSNG